MDKENVFDNQSIWMLEQIMEPLYTVSPDGKSVKPWLATVLHPLAGQEDLHVPPAPRGEVLERQAR